MAVRPTPTNAELAILRVLWAQGPSTVREVHTALTTERDMAYTTALKMLQVMTAKALTIRETRGTQHFYRARLPERQMQRRLVRDLLDRAFGGSTSQLVLQALAARRATPEELHEIRRLLAEHDPLHEEKDHD
jgi:BlaI family transcriptional regulator, penicillinase repressor